MASRVNTKFVVILIVAVVAMLGMLFVAYTVVYKTAADLAKKGDQAMAEGDYALAMRLYSVAVNKDPTIVENLEKWIDTIEMWTPETETAYYDAFQRDYMGAIHQAAIVQRTNVEAYHREIGLHYSMYMRQYSRGAGERIIARTTEALGNFDGLIGVDPLWPTLRRYRGMAWQRIGDRDGVIDEEQFELVREDLAAALEADPSDDEARVAQMRWTTYEAVKLARNEDLTGIDQSRLDAIEIGRAHLRDFPNSSLVKVAILAVQVEIMGAQAFYSESEAGSERTQAILDSWVELRGPLDELHENLLGTADSELSLNILNRFVEIEMRVDPDSKLERSKEIMAKLRAADPKSLDVLVSSAGLFAIRGDIEEAGELYDTIIALPIPPVSVDGVRLFNAQREAMLTVASIKLDAYSRSKTGDENGAGDADLLSDGIAARDLYAARVTEDNANLMLINGRIAFVTEEYEEALRLLNMYNVQTDNRNSDGLWFKALAARHLKQLGTAREALNALISIKKYDVRALLVLADIEMQLQEYRLAKSHFERVLVSSPGHSVALDGISKVNAYEDPSLIEDPVLSLVISARQLRRGKDGNPGDISAAITLLSEGLESVDFAPDAVRDLVAMLMDQGDTIGSRDLIERALAVHAEDESLIKMQTALRGDDEVDILVSMISQSNGSEIEKLISIAGVAYSRDRLELLDATIADLMKLAPNDSQVIDLAFVRALSLDDSKRAAELVKIATDGNVDRVNGLSYQARLASSEGNHERAAQLLEQAASSGIADSSIFRMLATEQRQLNRVDASITSFEEALSIRPNDQSSILGFIDTLVQFRRYPEALDVARRFQKYANENPNFMSVWLSLEAGYGGDEGQAFAIRQREKSLELDPKNTANNYYLASLYVQAGRWDESRSLIDELVSTDDSLQNTELNALWYANQGRIGKKNGIIAAHEVYLDYIKRHEDESNADPYIALARFLLNRGYENLAIQAASDAVDHQDPKTLDGTKLLGNLFMALNQYTNAADSFRTVIDAGADVENQYRLRLIDMMIRTRQFDSARNHFDQLEKKNTESMIAMLQNAEIEEGLGNMSIASDMLDKAVASYSENPLVYIKRAEFLTGTEENLTDMLADVDAALQINPNDWRAFRVRAAGYFAVDQREEALRDLQRAVRLNPMLDQALFGIVNEFMIDGRNAEAHDFAVEISASRNQDASLLNSLGKLFSSRGDWDRATLFYKSVWDAQRSPAAGAILIDAIVRTRNPDTNLANAIINDLTEVAGDINTSPGLLAAQALVLQARGRDELALSQLTKAFDLSSNSDDQLLQWSGNISRFFEDQPMQDQIDYISTLKRRNPNREVLNWLDLFIAQRLIGVGSQTDAAYAVYDRLIEASQQPRIQLITLQSYGTTMFTLGKFEKAAEYWGKGVELFPNDWEMNNNLAYVVSAELGDHERALTLAKHAIESNVKKRSEPYDTLGRVYTAMGQYDEAKDILNEGMKFALSVRARITLVIALIEVDLAKNELVEARSKVLDIRSLMRAMPTRDEGLEKQVDEVEAKIGSDG